MGRYKVVKNQAPKKKKPPKPDRFMHVTQKTPKTLEDCTKKDLLARIQEVMTRMWGKIPDDVMSENWSWDKFKTWALTPFLYMIYEEYNDSREI